MICTTYNIKKSCDYVIILYYLKKIIYSYRSNHKFTGFLVGPLLKRYSYRQVAFYGSLLSCSGLITSQANSMMYIICTYSILGGICRINYYKSVSRYLTINKEHMCF